MRWPLKLQTYNRIQMCILLLSLVWPRLSLANRNRDFFLNQGRSKLRHFPSGDDFFLLFLTLFTSNNCIFTVHAIHMAHNYFIIVTHFLRLSEKTLSCALVIRDCYYYRHFHSKLSASCIVVLCSDQKFMNVSHEKIDIKIGMSVFF